MQFQRPFRPWPIPTAEGNGRLQSIMQMKADDIQMTNDDHFHPLEFQVTAPRLSVCALIHRGSVTTRTRTTCPSSAPRRHRRRRRHLWLTLATILLVTYLYYYHCCCFFVSHVQLSSPPPPPPPPPPPTAHPPLPPPTLD